jgi:hypothetical protein
MHTETASTQKEEKKEWPRNKGSVGGSELGGGEREREKCLGINVALHACKKPPECSQLSSATTDAVTGRVFSVIVCIHYAYIKGRVYSVIGCIHHV